ncbi:hypothetical protein K466DRAFT_527456 [Polyporus arcularius HHB13444]|uniref:Uncharacterized protein n=1 Tax=Polyporus arcularius HHB13444 TaxID=1314778 RepID=A0A5C3P543_9APHY|nr:hypothetical protein K466DRAFT_527456 [Polyporus arcularius HHB13444]
MAPRSTRSTRSGKVATPSSKAKGSKYFNKKAKKVEDEDELTEPEVDEDYEQEEDNDASDSVSLHSDALDDEDDFESIKPASSTKRKRASASPQKTPSKGTPKKSQERRKSSGSGSARKKRKTKGSEDEDDEYELELEEGQEVVGTVVQAPKTGRVPPGQISKNTLDFLSELKKPECNDREWFKLHEPVYRLAETEWKAFVEHFTDLLSEADPQIPPLPPKDVIHRIYRDIRFSNDKTPYKTVLSASFSRSGRKGIFAGFKPDGQSLIAAGSWCPGKNELATIRNNIKRSSRRLRQVISAPDFEALFGPAHPHPKGERQNIFGMEDELKVAPKGVDKTHKDIDLLKCRSFAVVYKFTDKHVLQPEFKEELVNVAKVMRPFVHCLNDLMTIPNAGDSSGSDDEDGGEPNGDVGED